MKTKRMFMLIGVAALSLTATGASAAMRGSPMMTRPGMTRPGMARPEMARPAPRFAPRTMTGSHRFFNDRFHRFNRFHNRFNDRTFVFIDSFGFPFFYPFYPYPYSYYGYSPYSYYGDYYPNSYSYYSEPAYGYDASLVAQVQRRLGEMGYYHGVVDGIMGPQTRAAISAYEATHNLAVDGTISGPLLDRMGLS